MSALHVTPRFLHQGSISHVNHGFFPFLFSLREIIIPRIRSSVTRLFDSIFVLTLSLIELLRITE